MGAALGKTGQASVRTCGHDCGRCARAATWAGFSRMEEVGSEAAGPSSWEGLGEALTGVVGRRRA